MANDFAADTLRRLEAIRDPARRLEAANGLLGLDLYPLRSECVLQLWEQRAGDGKGYGLARQLARVLGFHEETVGKMLRDARRAREQREGER